MASARIDDRRGGTDRRDAPRPSASDAIAGGIRLTHRSPDPALAASTLAALFTAAFVIVAMTAGLLTGRWLVRAPRPL